MKNLSFLLLLLLAACSSTNSSNTTSTKVNPDSHYGDDERPIGTIVESSDNPKNIKGPVVQSKDPADLAMTEKIHQAILADNLLSPGAKKIKIITTSYKTVYLRGTVKDPVEQDRVLKMAVDNLSDYDLRDQLSVRTLP